ncbi:MAG: hypothetical protein E6J42_05755 [Chloroflexi bacterium]|nr:MAG: hypothetical protein E6J42_05755 [Chloroflexota bacterium]
MIEPTVDSEVSDAPRSDCAHHWQIETPAGEVSEAVCKLCGASRSFANYSQRRTTSRTIRPPAGTSSA